MNISDIILYHENRKKRAEDEGLLGSVSYETIIIDKLETIKGKQH